MISSTIDDLAPEREAVDRAIADFRFERFRSEALSSIGASPQEVCEEMARTCDVQVLIIGACYGSTIPELDISVTEMEFDVARTVDGSKVLVFVKSLPAGARQQKAERFLAKATDFTTGYFRAEPFRSPTQLYDQVKAALSIWISSRILKTRLSQGNVYALADSGSTWRSIGAFYLLIAALAALTSIAASLGGRSLSYFVPPLGQFVEMWTQHSGVLVAGILYSWSRAMVVFVAGVSIGFVTLVPFLAVPRRRLRLTVLIAGLGFFTVASFLFSFGLLIFGHRSYQLVGMALSVVCGVGLILQRERDRLPEALRFRDVFADVVPNALISPYLPTLFILASAVGFMMDLQFGAERGVGILYQEGIERFDSALSFSIVVSFAAVVGTTHLLLRALQGYATMTWIVWPRFRARKGAT